MHRTTSSSTLNFAAMQIIVAAAVVVLLLAGPGVGREFTATPVARRNLSGASHFRQPQTGVLLASRSKLASINRKRIQRLRRILGLEAFYPKPRLSRPDPDHKIHPYLLRNVTILASCAESRLEHRYYLHSDAQRVSLPDRRNRLVQPVYSELGTVQYTGGRLLPRRLTRGFPLGPTARLQHRPRQSIHLDGFSQNPRRSIDGRRAGGELCVRRVWVVGGGVFYCIEFSDGDHILDNGRVGEYALSDEFPEREYMFRLLAVWGGDSIQISMDGVKRFVDNILIERFWRTLKYELIYVSDFADGVELHHAIARFIDFYNNERPHQSLHYSTPARLYGECK